MVLVGKVSTAKWSDVSFCLVPHPPWPLTKQQSTDNHNYNTLFVTNNLQLSKSPLNQKKSDEVTILGRCNPIIGLMVDSQDGDWWTGTLGTIEMLSRGYLELCW